MRFIGTKIITAEAMTRAAYVAAPRVTAGDIETNIAGEMFFTAADGAHGTGAPYSQAHQLLTFCVLTLRNGFTVTGESACASPENFDAEIGRKIARQNAVQKIWPLMGYQLREQLHQIALAEEVMRQRPAPGAAYPGYSTMQPHQQRVVDEKCELDTRLAKLVPFFDTPIFAGLGEEEKQRLERQEEVMKAYSAILTERIAAFQATNSTTV